jgi:uncharacterized HAD superfamily protein
MMKIGIDLDDCITYSPQFFYLFTNAMKSVAEIHIITNREQSPGSEANTKDELQTLGIHYNHLKITGQKAKYIMENDIRVFFDDTDENLLELPESVTVFKIRESLNFDFEEHHKWVYSNKTGINIDQQIGS